MIPKVIHYCWLSEQPYPPEIVKCIQSWQDVLPDYEIILWDKSRFDIESNQFVSEACQAKKWAFAADYIRIHALFHHGGIYLDSDVFVKRRFDEFLHYEFFSSMEYHHQHVKDQSAVDLINEDGSPKSPFTPIPGIGIQAAVLGSTKKHPYLKECLEWYQDKHFIREDGTLNTSPLSPSVLAMIAERYGFRYLDVRQELKGDILILPSSAFAGALEYETDASYAVHRCLGSWRDKRPRRVSERIRAVLRRLFSLG